VSERPSHGPAYQKSFGSFLQKRTASKKADLKKRSAFFIRIVLYQRNLPAAGESAMIGRTEPQNGLDWSINGPNL
jgi:hypothetical protein